MLPQTMKELERARESCRAMVKRRALMLAGVALVPVPGIDLLADIGALKDVIPRINRRFGLTPEMIGQLDERKRSTVHEMIRKVGADFVGKSVTRRLILAALARMGKRAVAKRTVKFFPLAGQTLAAAWSYSTMMMVGNAHVDACYRIVKEAMRREAEERGFDAFGAMVRSDLAHAGAPAGQEAREDQGGQ